MIITINKVKYFLIPLLLYSSCTQDEKNPIALSPNPVIDTISIPARWNTRLDIHYTVEVKVLDAQGSSNIISVQMEVYNSQTSAMIFTGSLYDDAAFYHPQDGDVVAGDGVYSNRFTATEMVPALTAGEYRFQFVAIDQQGNQSQEQARMVFFGTNYSPVITRIAAPDTFSSTQSAAIINIVVTDKDGITDIDRAYFESQSQARIARIYESDLYNDGNYEQHGDLTAGDSIFSVRLDAGFSIGKQGDYNLFFYALDSFMEKNINVPQHTIFIGNTPPQIINVVVPDTMQLPVASGTYNRKLLTAQIYDAQGLADIDSVYFYSRKPDSTLANNGQPILLVDNGYPFNPSNPGVETGDQQAGDGIYSFSLLVSSDALTGIYTFTFYARDKAGNLSAAQVRVIEIVEGN